MPALRRLNIFRRPELFLAAWLVLLALTILDAFRPPSRQLTARVYVTAVHAYQRWGRTLTSRVVSCRYRPTCSEYSIEAVRKFGVGRGLALTMNRLWRCRGDVRPGTPDPVP